MRITDDRYTRDLLRFDLALRMIHHEARTCTIRLCTGLTDDRIRKLYKSYVATTGATTVRRKRGKSPRQVAFFTRNTFTQLEASLLAGLFTTLGLLRDSHAGTGGPRSPEFGGLFCDAYETYRQFWRGTPLSFEHAWFLLLALSQGEDLRIDRCMRCEGSFVRDAYSLKVSCCPLCRMKNEVDRSRRRLADRTSPPPSPRPVVADRFGSRLLQGELPLQSGACVSY